MAKNNFYGVKVGLVPGVYDNWESCQENVKGVPGAKYQGFKTRGEAEVFVYGHELAYGVEKATVDAPVLDAPAASIQAALDLFGGEATDPHKALIDKAVEDIVDVLGISDASDDEYNTLYNRLKKLLADTKGLSA